MSSKARGSPPSAAALFAGHTLFQSVNTADPAQRNLWARCELAIFAEHRLATVIDPCTLTDGAFAKLCRRALAHNETLSDLARHTFFQPFWIQADGRMAGMVAFTLVPNTPRPFVQVWDFYLLPAARGQGLGRTVLDTVFATAVANGFDGFRLSTEWIYQKAVRYYLRRGLWLTGWKRHLDFARYAGLPDFCCEFTNQVARFAILSKDCNGLLYSARRDGPFLKLSTAPLAQRLDTTRPILLSYALCTFSLGLALNGWPLVRSAEAWDNRFGCGDGGMPEGLAYKIELFEAWAKEQGFLVLTPRIPGLAYRDWQTLMKE